MGHFGFFQLIKNYAETTLLIDEKIISQEASYAAQQSLRRVKSPKIIYYQVISFSLILVFGDLTLLKLCWAA